MEITQGVYAVKRGVLPKKAPVVDYRKIYELSELPRLEARLRTELGSIQGSMTSGAKIAPASQVFSNLPF